MEIIEQSIEQNKKTREIPEDRDYKDPEGRVESRFHPALPHQTLRRPLSVNTCVQFPRTRLSASQNFIRAGATNEFYVANFIRARPTNEFHVANFIRARPTNEFYVANFIRAGPANEFYVANFIRARPTNEFQKQTSIGSGGESFSGGEITCSVGIRKRLHQVMQPLFVGRFKELLRFVPGTKGLPLCLYGTCP